MTSRRSDADRPAPPPAEAHPGRLRVEVLDRLGDRSSDWDRLVDESPLPSPFLRSWWVDHAAEGTPTLVCCFDGDRLVGGAAFQSGHIGPSALAVEHVRSLGQGPLAPDHLDVVAAPGHRSEVTRAVLEWLHRPGNRVVDLDGLAADGSLGRVLAHDVIESIAAPFADLAPDLASYLAGRPGRVRSTLKRTRKRLERDGVSYRQVAPGDISAGLTRLSELHDGRWADESSFLSAWDRFAAAATAGAAAGEVTLHELVAPGDGHLEGDQPASQEVVIATELDLGRGERIAFYQAGRRTDHEWRGSGSVLRSMILERACPAGATEYDLLRGDEPYKAEWSTGQRRLVRARFAVGTGARALLGLHAAKVVVDRARASGTAYLVSRRGPSTPASTAPDAPSD